ncbi:leucyl aminopeptidase [Geothermobacter ehrlichii]|uniref:Probable cytosol aminopeptidase n=1 Tax=Geothermobacter ehrlichii TaxID=213224 RepID=A0A5D3WMI8_9BACT|nr:leucyl aminopeptidase [Geothermobacter ehrlichii]TYO99296.1 leucyl aminopeptidase [Geothermobacter ehrlichii]
MKLQVRSTDPLKQKTPCLVLAVRQGSLTSDPLKSLDRQLGGRLARSRRDGEFDGTAGQTLLLHCGDEIAPDRVLLVGLGKPGPTDTETARRAAGRAIRLLREKKLDRLAVHLPSFDPVRNRQEIWQAVIEGLLLGAYSFDRYIGEKKERPRPMREALLLAGSRRHVTPLGELAARAAAVCAGVRLARDLVNLPGNAKAPEELARQAEQLAEEEAIECTIFDRCRLEKEGFGALLGVAQGSSREPRLITLEYRGADSGQKPIALVGKGVVFDAGGISLKPAEKMDEMKMDMAGAAAVLGTLRAAARLRLPINLVGIVPAVENLPSGTAYRPGDILTSLSGKTIEVLNTDAEGRLILADALTWAGRFEPEAIIDLATLTGACIIALGHHASAVLGNNQGLVRQLLAAGERSGERLWQLPLWDDYGQQLKSKVADLKNIGGRAAGTITAAAFLKAFVGKNRWAHIDIAGTAWKDQEEDYRSFGGSGVGVRLLIDFLSRR